MGPMWWLGPRVEWVRIGHPLCIIHCVAHKLELALLDAVKKCPYLSTLEDTVKDVYKFYFYSLKRRREVNEIANIIDEDVVYYSGLQKTRWLASRYRAIAALEKHYVTTVVYLQHKTGSTREDGAHAKGILKQLLSEKFVKHLYFLLDVMKILSDLSKSFQQDQLRITDVVATLETSMTMLEELKLQRGCQYKKFLDSYSEETARFICGKDKGHQLQQTHPGNMLNQQFDTFLSEAVTYLGSRFGNLQDEPYSLFGVFDPRETPQNLAAYGHHEIRSLVQYFGHFLTEKEQESILDQWSMLQTRLNRQKANGKQSCWCICKPSSVKTWWCQRLPHTPRSDDDIVTIHSYVREEFLSHESAEEQCAFTDLSEKLGRLDESTFCCFYQGILSSPAISHWILDAKTKRHIL